MRWYRLLVLVSFGVTVFVYTKFFPQDQSWVELTPAFVVLLGDLVIIIYTFYMTYFGLKCPKCGWNFGSRDKCSTCGLPRHAERPSHTPDLDL